LLPLEGIPLLVHSIEYAKKNHWLIDKILVSTEDEEIKSVAENHGIEVLDRPEQLAGDHTPTIDVLKDALQQLGAGIENVILLQVTNPLRPENLLQQAFTLFNEKQADSLMTVTRNYQKFGKIENEKFTPFNYKLGQRSQDLEPLFFENGLLYISKSQLIESGTIIGPHHIPMVIDHPYAHVDIDTSHDLQYAEFLLNSLKKI
jgi:N-acylneuraminate cytidylyltransferase